VDIEGRYIDGGEYRDEGSKDHGDCDYHYREVGIYGKGI
jgi:hypothetical protein